MTKCHKCNTDNPDTSKFCTSCGAAINEIQQDKPVIVELDSSSKSQKTYPNLEHSSSGPVVTPIATRSKITTKGIAIVIVALLAIAGIGYYAADNYGNSAYIALKVSSTHLTEDVDVQFLIDGEVVGTFQDLAPGHYYYSEKYYIHNFGILHSSDIVTVGARSTGGGLGMVEDYEQIIVVPGEKVTVELYV